VTSSARVNRAAVIDMEYGNGEASRLNTLSGCPVMVRGSVKITARRVKELHRTHNAVKHGGFADFRVSDLSRLISSVGTRQ